MYQRILVPTDGSALSKKAARGAIELAKAVGAELVALHVVPRYPTSYFEGAVVLSPAEVARTEKVLKASASRVVPKCPHFGVCGGCSMQHLDPSAQVAAKQRLLESNLWHLARLKAEQLFPPIYGEAWGWPPQTMTVEADRDDLAHHVDEMEALEGFNYAVLDDAETTLLGCVYIYPSAAEADADVSWWVVDAERDGELERALDEALRDWFADTWGFGSVRRHP